MKNEEEKNNIINFKKLIIIFFFSLIANFLGSWYGYAMTHGQIITQAILGMCIPFSNLFSSNAFIEAKNFKDRVKITFVAGLAVPIGSTLMLLFQKYLF